jgi:hypothetical protein
MMHVFPATYPVGPCCVQNLLINKLVAWFVVLILYCIDAGFWYAESAEWHLFCTKRTKMIIVRSSFSCFFNVIWICELSSVHSFSSQSGERRHCCLFRCTSFQKVYYSNPKHQELTVSISAVGIVVILYFFQGDLGVKLWGLLRANWGKGKWSLRVVAFVKYI